MVTTIYIPAQHLVVNSCATAMVYNDYEVQLDKDGLYSMGGLFDPPMQRATRHRSTTHISCCFLAGPSSIYYQ